ncbi:hypothetical protein RB595_010173 [Gaeumannomyces hyphopodioides]
MAFRFSQLLVSAMLLAGLVSAQVGTMCRNQTPFLNCGANVVKTAGVTCESYTQSSLKTPCICSTLSLHYSCYVSLCPSDNLNDVYESRFNSMKCPNAPPLKTAGGGGGRSPTTPAASAATTTAGAGAAGTSGAAAGPTAGGATANAGGQQKNAAGVGMRFGAAAEALVSAGGLVGFAVAVFSALAYQGGGW